ncbi:MAG: hypothetical protein HYT85_00420, partial [candidate division NC10 bacterium]|nr:hypothetical protein [candidate division NC10 bacterium]
MDSWYIILSRVSAGLSGPVNALADQVNVPMVSVFLFGIIGAAAPCQLTTNLSAMAFVSRRSGSETSPLQ